MTPDVTQLHRALVAFPCLSGEEAPIADFVQDYVGGFGLEVHRHEDNIWFSVGNGPDGLLLNSHLDVVPASRDHPFPPFEPTVHEGRVYGRGTVDAKASGAAMVTAAIRLAQAGHIPASGRLVVALTASEESGWPYNGLNETRPHLPDFGAAVIGEPTSLAPCIAQKGLLILRLVAEGRTAHAARAHLGENAVLKAASDLHRLEALRFERVHPVLGPVTVTPTTIEGGSARNVVPDQCTVYIDVRSTPEYPHEAILQHIRDAVASRVEVHSDRLISVATEPTERIVRAAVTAVPDQAPFGSPTLSDWIFLSDIPAVKLGPGDSERSHTPDESIALDDLQRGVDVYSRLVKAYFAA